LKKMDARFLIYTWLRIKPCLWLHENLSCLWFVFAEFWFECSSCSLCSWCLICFCVFFICFWFNCLFWFSFGSNHDFRFESGLNQFFQVNLIRFGLDQVLRHCLVGYFFYWRIFGLKYCITNTLLDLFWQFCFE
jgi:hypothetical protein